MVVDKKVSTIILLYLPLFADIYSFFCLLLVKRNAIFEGDSKSKQL